MGIIVRSMALFLFVWVVLRAVGRKELSELTSFELVIVIVMGDLIQQGVTGDDRSIVGAMLAVATFGLLTLFFSYLAYRFDRARPPIEGVPAIVVLHGEVKKDILGIERLTFEDLAEAAREQGIGDLSEVELGVLESGGKFSFIRTGGERPPAESQAIK
jgi:uncharacterized membrane protein YcaP (DUF421 family)